MRVTAQQPKDVPSVGDRILQKGLDATRPVESPAPAVRVVRQVERTHDVTPSPRGAKR